jgi:acetyltransferase
VTSQADVTTRVMSSGDLRGVMPELANVLASAVNGGASLGFIPPMSLDDAHDYWFAIRAELHSGRRLMVGAFCGDSIVGAGQLLLPSWPNAAHRAEIQKMVVAESMRGRGVGRSLMEALHSLARDYGRTLILLNTRHGSPAERFYRSLGYEEVGVVPGYTLGPAGELLDSVAMYKDIGPVLSFRAERARSAPQLSFRAEPRSGGGEESQSSRKRAR